MKLENSLSTSALKNCQPNLKMFLAALSFAYFSKALTSSYIKRTVIQLERRFNFPNYLIGIMDGSFEIGNLLVIVFVSYFGAKLHRPKIITVGCVLMSLGTFLIAMPHFTNGRYNIETSIRSSVNSTDRLSLCPVNSSSEAPRKDDRSSLLPSTGLLAAKTTFLNMCLSEVENTWFVMIHTPNCEQEFSVSLWMYVLLGNVLRGIGETPVQSLGISFIDDYAESENSALYIGCVQTFGVIGPAFGFLLGSLCAKIYVDIGYVDKESVTITPEDVRWVGAWWLGYLIAGVITLMSAVPFWFLPKSLPMPVDKHDNSCTPDQTRLIKDSSTMSQKIRPEMPANFHLMANEFVPTIRSLLRNPVYIICLCVMIIQFNSLIGIATYEPKYIEQHYGHSASKAYFLMGMINIPAVALGMFSGGVVMKKYKLGVLGAAKFAFGTSLLGYFLSLLFLAMGCENSKVAGITVSYAGVKDFSYEEQSLFSDCNLGCQCSIREWDPLCGENGVTYASPCLAGCTLSTGSGRNMMFHNCRCVAVTNSHPVNLTATFGQCLHRESCDKVFPYFLAVSILSSFIISLGGTPVFMLLVRCINPELKSLALGIHILTLRTLAEIPAPMYFGVITDSTCLKWEYNTCGEKGACRLYNTSAYRTACLGLTFGLRAVSFFLCIWGFALFKGQIQREEKKALTNENGELEFLSKEENNSADCEQFILASDCIPDRETYL